MSKGSAPRPLSVTKESFDQSFDWTFGVTCKKCDYMQINEGKEGHCYMFREKPDSCGCFKESGNVPIE